MKFSDYVLDFVSSLGVKKVFGVTGGAVVHLFDSAAAHPDIDPVFCHHEQAAAFAAAAYARTNNSFGAAIVTTGPGGSNALTGLLGAWQDSIPFFVVSGQSRAQHLSRGRAVRQVSPQEFDIAGFVEPMTKYSTSITDPQRVRYELEKAKYFALEGRSGPVWIDIPVNFQWEEIDPQSLESFSSEQLPKSYKTADISSQIELIKEKLQQAERPLLMAGYGVRLAGAEQAFAELVEELQIPFVTSWTAGDFLPSSHPCNLGRLGFCGQRGANFAVQNCDFLLAIGTHLSIPQTGTLFDAFAREAEVAMVNIDPAQLEDTNVAVDYRIHADAKDFIAALLEASDGALQMSEVWSSRYPRYQELNAVPEEHFQLEDKISGYALVDSLSRLAGEGEVIAIDGGGTALYQGFQAWNVKPGQRLILSSSICSMGSGLPEAVGASFARDKARVICIIGDGSFQFNVQELQTILHHELPIKTFVVNNEGYLAMRHTQDGFLGSRYVGSTVDGGISCPDTEKICAAYGVPFVRYSKFAELQAGLPDFLAAEGPGVCEIMAPADAEMVPSQGFEELPDGKFRPLPLEDMKPRLPRDLFSELMCVREYDPDKK